MCKCTPEIRTPFCGRGDCLPPGYALAYEAVAAQERIDGWKREFQKVQAKRDAYRERAEQAEARVAELTAALEDVQAIQSEYDGKPNLIPVAGWAAIRERLQHADVRAAMEGR